MNKTKGPKKKAESLRDMPVGKTTLGELLGAVMKVKPPKKKAAPKAKKPNK